MGIIFPPVSFGDTQWCFERTLVFGVVNVTPDSFFDGGQHLDPQAAIAHGELLARQGAHVLDVGGESTRPGAGQVSAEQELERVLPVLRGLRDSVSIPLSVDTYKAQVAEAAVEAGASIINDISGLMLDDEMAQVVARTGATVILGHMRGKPATMQRDVEFVDVVAEVVEELRESIRTAIRAGVGPDRVWVDPGIGFGKTAQQSLLLLRNTGRIREALGYPVLVGPSRKSFIGAVTGEPVEERLMGTCAAVAAVIASGADGVRIHDVEALGPAVAVADAIHRGEPCTPR